MGDSVLPLLKLMTLPMRGKAIFVYSVFSKPSHCYLDRVVVRDDGYEVAFKAGVTVEVGV